VPTQRLGRQLLAIATALLAALFVAFLPVTADASASRPLQVTFTFDDGVADQLTGQQLLEKYGMSGTFYINSSFIGLPGYMTRANLDQLKAKGHEIGGHTVKTF
jgi:peptidoglycan/xylan/chitin deacetylase (PgdA/CDA1 family)